MKITLSTKMAVPGVALAIGLSLFVYIAVPQVLRSVTVNAVAARTNTIAEMTAVSASVGLYFEQYETVRTAVGIAQKNDDLAYLVIADAAGDVVAAYNLDVAKALRYSLRLPDEVIEDERVFTSHVLVEMQGQVLGELYVGLSLVEHEAVIDRYQFWIGIITLIMLLIGFAVILFVSYYVTRPLKRVAEGSKTLADGDLSYRIELGSNDEFDEISTALNHLAQALEDAHDAQSALKSRLEDTERKKADADDPTGTAPTRDHELRTPLNGIIGTTRMLMDSGLTSAQMQMAELVATSADTLAKSLAVTVADRPSAQALPEESEPEIHGEPLPEFADTEKAAPESKRNSKPSQKKAPDRLPETPKPSAFEPDDIRSLRILLAEDNPVNQRVMSIFCKRFGVHPDIADNGKKAIEELEARPYDVVFMDLHMPEMGGIAAARHIKKEWSAEERPYIIALTADVTQTSQEACFNAGMSDFLAKPVTVDQVHDALLRFMESEHRWLRGVNQQAEDAAAAAAS